MSGLTQQDMNVLSYYAEKGDRVRYWNHLAQRPGADGYGRLALSVVRNDETPGALANHFADITARTGGKIMSSADWEKFGRDLLKRDYDARVILYDEGKTGDALNLRAETIERYHDETFKDYGISELAWTPKEAFITLRRSGGDSAVEDFWRKLLDDSFLGANRFRETLGSVFDITSSYTYKLAGAYFSAVFDINDFGNADRIDAQRFIFDNGFIAHWNTTQFSYDSDSGTWTLTGVPDGTVPISLIEHAYPGITSYLNDERALRLQRINTEKYEGDDTRAGLPPSGPSLIMRVQGC